MTHYRDNQNGDVPQLTDSTKDDVAIADSRREEEGINLDSLRFSIARIDKR